MRKLNSTLNTQLNSFTTPQIYNYISKLLKHTLVYFCYFSLLLFITNPESLKKLWNWLCVCVCVYIHFHANYDFSFFLDLLQLLIRTMLDTQILSQLIKVLSFNWNMSKKITVYWSNIILYGPNTETNFIM